MPGVARSRAARSSLAPIQTAFRSRARHRPSPSVPSAASGHSEREAATHRYPILSARVHLQSHAVLGPYSYARLVEGISTGEIGRGDRLELEARGLIPIEEVAELARFLRPSAPPSARPRPRSRSTARAPATSSPCSARSTPPRRPACFWPNARSHTPARRSTCRRARCTTCSRARRASCSASTWSAVACSIATSSTSRSAPCPPTAVAWATRSSRSAWPSPWGCSARSARRGATGCRPTLLERRRAVVPPVHRHSTGRVPARPRRARSHAGRHRPQRTHPRRRRELAAHRARRQAAHRGPARTPPTSYSPAVAHVLGVLKQPQTVKNLLGSAQGTGTVAPDDVMRAAEVLLRASSPGHADRAANERSIVEV